MKKFLIALAIVSVPALTGINRASGQAKADVEISNLQKNNNAIKKMTTPVKDYYITDPEVINPKALKDFDKNYKNAEAVRWVRGKDGFYVEFILNDIKTRVFYDAYGKWFGSVRTYSEDKLPQTIRGIVKSQYYDYSIFFVEELEIVQSDGIPTYLVHLEDKNNIKLLRIFDGEMEVWRHYVKR